MLPATWTEAQAEQKLRSLELFGMRFGLDRMRRMMTALGSPERRFPAVQVLGTNGKTSTTRMTAAILARHGLRTASYTSPHLVSYRERIQVAERDVGAQEFAAAIARASWAAERVDRTLAADDHVTQFELLTAAALWLMAEQEVEVAVIEAGLGGRYDATSVIAAPVAVLTNVGLEHTRWLGPTIGDIAEEKLAALAPGATLVLPAALAPEAETVAQRHARERGDPVVRAGSSYEHAGLRAPGAFQRRNFALARAAAGEHLRRAGIALDEDAVRAAAATAGPPGRLQLIGEHPPTLLDGAHNPDAVAALVEALPEALDPALPLAVVLGVLEDKDAAAMLARILPLCERAWFTAPPSSRALSPAALQSLARQLGFERTACEPDALAALAQAREWALAAGGAVLVTGSVYLAGEVLAASGERPREAGARSAQA